MSSNSDQAVFQTALEAQDNTVLFQSKKYASIPDNSSNGGVFSGQMQFNLNTLSNLSQWNNLAEGVITFPIRIQLSADTTLTSAPSTTMLTAIIKNGFFQFVDSIQATIGGTTIQNAQIFENVNTTYKVLSDWSLDEYNKYGPSLGISLDDYQLAVDGGIIPTGLDNEAATTTIAAYKGFTIPPGRNPGFKSRALFSNSSVDAATTANTILNNAKALGKGQLKIDNSATLAAGSNTFTMFALATIRLADNCHAISVLPPCKNLKGNIYVNYNAGTYQFKTDKTTGAITTSTLPKSAQPTYGHTFPVMLGDFQSGAAAADPTWTLTVEVSGQAVNGVSPPQTNARLIVPYYVPNPTVDKALSMKKKIRYHERFITSFDVAPLQSYESTITPGVVNPKRIILLPSLKGDTSTKTAGSLLALADAPERSPWTHEPAGSGPFAAISGLQFIVGGVPMFQQPVDMDWQMFLQEMSLQGENGGQDVEEASGLLNQRLWNQLYRFYTCDISRRMDSEDGNNKSVNIQMTNATKATMHVIAMVWYEREMEVDTVMGQITQGV